MESDQQDLVKAKSQDQPFRAHRQIQSLNETPAQLPTQIHQDVQQNDLKPIQLQNFQDTNYLLGMITSRSKQLSPRDNAQSPDLSEQLVRLNNPDLVLEEEEESKDYDGLTGNRHSMLFNQRPNTNVNVQNFLKQQNHKMRNLSMENKHNNIQELANHRKWQDQINNQHNYFKAAGNLKQMQNNYSGRPWKQSCQQPKSDQKPRSNVGSALKRYKDGSIKVSQNRLQPEIYKDFVSQALNNITSLQSKIVAEHEKISKILPQIVDEGVPQKQNRKRYLGKTPQLNHMHEPKHKKSISAVAPVVIKSPDFISQSQAMHEIPKLHVPNGFSTTKPPGMNYLNPYILDNSQNQIENVMSLNTEANDPSIDIQNISAFNKSYEKKRQDFRKPASTANIHKKLKQFMSINQNLDKWWFPGAQFQSVVLQSPSTNTAKAEIKKQHNKPLSSVDVHANNNKAYGGRRNIKQYPGDVLSNNDINVIHQEITIENSAEKMAKLNEQFQRVYDRRRKDLMTAPNQKRLKQVNQPNTSSQHKRENQCPSQIRDQNVDLSIAFRNQSPKKFFQSSSGRQKPQKITMTSSVQFDTRKKQLNIKRSLMQNVTSSNSNSPIIERVLPQIQVMKSSGSQVTKTASELSQPVNLEINSMGLRNSQKNLRQETFGQVEIFGIMTEKNNVAALKEKYQPRKKKHKSRQRQRNFGSSFETKGFTSTDEKFPDKFNDMLSQRKHTKKGKGGSGRSPAEVQSKFTQAKRTASREYTSRCSQGYPRNSSQGKSSIRTKSKRSKNQSKMTNREIQIYDSNVMKLERDQAHILSDESIRAQEILRNEKQMDMQLFHQVETAESKYMPDMDSDPREENENQVQIQRLSQPSEKNQSQEYLNEFTHSHTVIPTQENQKTNTSKRRVTSNDETEQFQGHRQVEITQTSVGNNQIVSDNNDAAKRSSKQGQSILINTSSPNLDKPIQVQITHNSDKNMVSIQIDDHFISANKEVRISTNPKSFQIRQTNSGAEEPTSSQNPQLNYGDNRKTSKMSEQRKMQLQFSDQGMSKQKSEQITNKKGRLNGTKVLAGHTANMNQREVLKQETKSRALRELLNKNTDLTNHANQSNVIPKGLTHELSSKSRIVSIEGNYETHDKRDEHTHLTTQVQSPINQVENVPLAEDTMETKREQVYNIIGQLEEQKQKLVFQSYESESVHDSKFSHSLEKKRLIKKEDLISQRQGQRQPNFTQKSSSKVSMKDYIQNVQSSSKRDAKSKGSNSQGMYRVSLGNDNRLESLRNLLNQEANDDQNQNSKEFLKSEQTKTIKESRISIKSREQNRNKKKLSELEQTFNRLSKQSECQRDNCKGNSREHSKESQKSGEKSSKQQINNKSLTQDHFMSKNKAKVQEIDYSDQYPYLAVKDQTKSMGRNLPKAQQFSNFSSFEQQQDQKKQLTELHSGFHDMNSHPNLPQAKAHTYFQSNSDNLGPRKINMNPELMSKTSSKINIVDDSQQNSASQLFNRDALKTKLKAKMSSNKSPQKSSSARSRNDSLGKKSPLKEKKPSLANQKTNTLQSNSKSGSRSPQPGDISKESISRINKSSHKKVPLNLKNQGQMQKSSCKLEGKKSPPRDKSSNEQNQSSGRYQKWDKSNHEHKQQKRSQEQSKAKPQKSHQDADSKTNSLVKLPKVATTTHGVQTSEFSRKVQKDAHGVQTSEFNQPTAEMVDFQQQFNGELSSIGTTDRHPGGFSQNQNQERHGRFKTEKGKGNQKSEDKFSQQTRGMSEPTKYNSGRASQNYVQAEDNMQREHQSVDKALSIKGQDQVSVACGDSSNMTKSDRSGSRPRVKPRIYVETDWAETPIYTLVTKLLALDSKDKISESKAMLESFLNPEGHDIFTEEEASYYSSLLRRQGSTDQTLEDTQKELVEAMYLKAKRSLTVLSNHLNLTMDDFNRADEQENNSQPQKFHFSPRQAIILHHKNYQEVNLESVIKLLIRIRICYQCIQEVIKILSIVQSQKNLYSEVNGQNFGKIYDYINKYSFYPDFKEKLSPNDQQYLVTVLQKLQSLSRRISRLLLEHRLFKSFVIGKKNFQKTLLNHALNIIKLFHQRGSRDVKTKYGEAYLSDFIQFNEVEVAESQIGSGNAQDPDNVHDDYEVHMEKIFKSSSMRNMKQFQSGPAGKASDINSVMNPYQIGIYSQRTDSQEQVQTIYNYDEEKINIRSMVSDAESIETKRIGKKMVYLKKFN